MFETLIASTTPRRRTWAQGAMSVLTHAAVLVPAVWATTSSTGAPLTPPDSTSLIWVAPAPRPTQPAASAAASASPAASAPSLPTGIVPPADIPLGIPPIELGTRFDPATLVLGVREGPPSIGMREPAGTGVGEILAEAQVDVPVSVVTMPSPVYPSWLRQAGVAGRVTVRFVVDTLGRPEPGSIEVVQSTHEGFEASVREAIARARFTPARVRGRAVRQLVVQGVGFEVK